MSDRRLHDAFAYVEAQADITTAEAITLYALADRANVDTDQAYPSLKTLQKATRLGKRAQQYALRQLEARKAIQTILGAGRRSSTYQLRIPHIDRTTRRCTTCTSEVHHMHPNLSLNQKKEKKSEERETYTSRAREESPDQARVGMRHYLTPGSQLWIDIETTLGATNGHSATHA